MKLRILNKIALASALLILLAIPAKAGVDFGIGAVYNMADFETSGVETEGTGAEAAANTGTEVSTATKKTKSVDYGHIFAEMIIKADEGLLSYIGLSTGIDIQPGTHQIRSESRTDTAADSGEGQIATETHAATAEVKNIVAIYLEPTLYINDMIGIYAKSGVQRMSVAAKKTGGTSRYEDQVVYGHVTGAGIRLTHGSGVYLKYEHVETDYDSIIMKSTTGNRNHISADLDQTTDRISIGYKF